MASDLIFAMSNDFKQGDAIGICTCISLNWAKKTLQLGRGLKTLSEIGLNGHTMNAQMAVLRKLDNQPAQQCELVGLEMIGNDMVITTIDDITRLTNATAPHVAILWTQTHTMGYGYIGHYHYFFDVEVGMYRSRYVKNIKKTMSDIINNYGPVQGLRLVKLAS
jgi:hypothetical protein